MKRNSAFSLLEVSTVILIVGLLSVGIFISSGIIKKSKISRAQVLTRNSPISEIKDLALWYETSLDTSFIESEKKDGSSISIWYDNSNQTLKKNNATQTNSSLAPIFTADVFDQAIPALRFNGISSYLNYNGLFLVNTSYTIFVVEQRRSSGNEQYFMGGDSGSSNEDLVLGYRNNTTMTQAHYYNDLDITVSGYINPKPVINTFWLSTVSGGGKRYWQNGGVNPDESSTGSTHEIALLNYLGAAIGKHQTKYYTGDIAEIIIFTRALQTEERQAVEDYLSRKYNIVIS